MNPVFQFLGLDWDPSLLDKVFSVKHDLGGGDYKIELTNQIEKDRVGKGAQVDKALLALVPPHLKQRRQSLNQLLGYTD
jgi:hypothetical protein